MQPALSRSGEPSRTGARCDARSGRCRSARGTYRSHPMKHLSPTDSPDRFTGLRVAVTGGTSGLGLALVRELLGRGARVAFVARMPDRVAAVAAAHPGAHGVVGDVSVQEDVHPIAVQVVGELGGLDMLVDNASPPT